MKQLLLLWALCVGLPLCAQNAPSPTTGEHNGHEWVDLGLSVKWATCNLGASKPHGRGKYFAWGETKPRSKRNERPGATYREGLENISGNPQYDAARANWGGTWRIPTSEEWQELIDNCTWEGTMQGRRKGCKITGPNGNHIFLPLVTHGDNAENDEAMYMSATSHSDSPYSDVPHIIMYLFLDEEGIDFNEMGDACICNFIGIPIRAVCD